MNDGWVFLSSFFRSWESITVDDIILLASREYSFGKQKYQWKNPTLLLDYLMSLGLGTTTSHRAILHMINIFTQFLNSKQEPILITYDRQEFTRECKYIDVQRDDIYQAQIGRLYHYNPSTNYPNHKENRKQEDF